jgi:hypothetical protein
MCGVCVDLGAGEGCPRNAARGAEDPSMVLLIEAVRCVDVSMIGPALGVTVA